MSEKRQQRVPIIIPAVLTLAIVICGIAFFFKLYKFSSTLWGSGSDMLGFALIPVSNYLMVAGGFFLLLIWAFLKGQFANIEQAKYDLIDDDIRYEAAERRRRIAERQGSAKHGA